MKHARLGLLLAAASIAALPAAAQAQDRGDWRGRGGDSARPVGPGRGEGPRNFQNGGAQFERRAAEPQPAAPVAQPAPPPPAAQVDRRPDGQDWRANRGNWNRGEGGQRWGRPDGDGRRAFNASPAPPPAGVQSPQRFDGDRQQWQDRRSDGRDRQQWQDRRFDGRDRQQWQDRRADSRQFDNRRFDDRGAWQRGWRNDRRYDWQGWRSHNRALFRAPRYYPPRGFAFGYRAFSPGFRLDPFFYDQGYWIADPWDYRLPPAYGPYRWVRYYNDVLLVDITNGVVVDVIQNFFW